MGRHIGGHAHSDAGSTVYQQVGETSGQHYRLATGVVVVGLEVHCVRVEILQHLLTHTREAHLGVTHGCGAVAID